MVALPVIPISAESGLDNPTTPRNQRTPIVISACLVLLLSFSTVTAFVQAAWAPQSFQIGVFTVLAIYLIAAMVRRHEPATSGLAPWLVYLIPVWGLIQIVAHTTVSTVETRTAVLSWGAFAGLFFLTHAVARTRTIRRNLLSAFLIFATAVSVLCLLELFTAGGNVLWTFPSGYSGVYATFISHNAYAEFVELALPIALWRALREGWRSWWYVPAGGLLYASVIGSASRAGAALCTLEVLAALVIALVKLRDPETGLPTRPTTAMLLMVPVLAGVFTLAVGWDRVWGRFQQHEPYLNRKEFMMSAVDMARHHPLTGYGLGTFPDVYLRYATRDFPLTVNHTHNDWAEFAADGGFPFLLLVLIPFAAAVPAAIRNPWGLGLIAIMLHACVDFPFFHPGVPGWMFMLLALLYRSRLPDAATSEKGKRTRSTGSTARESIQANR